MGLALVFHFMINCIQVKVTGSSETLRLLEAGGDAVYSGGNPMEGKAIYCQEETHRTGDFIWCRKPYRYNEALFPIDIVFLHFIFTYSFLV